MTDEESILALALNTSRSIDGLNAGVSRDSRQIRTQKLDIRRFIKPGTQVPSHLLHGNPQRNEPPPGYGEIPQSLPVGPVAQIELPPIKLSDGRVISYEDYVQMTNPSAPTAPDHAPTHQEGLQTGGFNMPSFGAQSQPSNGNASPDQLELIMKEIKSLKKAINKLIRIVEPTKLLSDESSTPTPKDT